jgi:hypothetical protein
MDDPGCCSCKLKPTCDMACLLQGRMLEMQKAALVAAVAVQVWGGGRALRCCRFNPYGVLGTYRHSLYHQQRGS